MPFTAKLFQVFIASPSDLGEQRSSVRSTIERWNRSHAAAEQAVFIPVRWEWAVATQGGDGQTQINQQQVESADLIIAMFNEKLGHPTSRYKSGTVEEIALGMSLGKSVHILRKLGLDNIPKNQVAEFNRLEEYLEEKYLEGLVQSFNTEEELSVRIDDVLWKIVRANRSVPAIVSTATLDGILNESSDTLPPAKWDRVPTGDNWSDENNGDITFDYQRYNGAYYFGFGDDMFLTQWTEAGDGSIWAYGEADSSIKGVALVPDFHSEHPPLDTNLLDHVRLDFTSTRQRAMEGDLLVFRKATNVVLTLLVVRVTIRTTADPAAATRLTCRYQIVQWDALPMVARL